MENISKIDWYYWPVRERSPLLLYLIYHGPTVVSLPGMKLFINTNGSCCNQILTKKSELLRHGRIIWNKFSADNSFLLKVFNNAYVKFGKDLKKWQALPKLNYSEMSDLKLLNLYQSYVKNLLEYSAYLYIPITVDERLEAEVKKQFSNESDYINIYDAIMTPIKESALLAEKISLLKIACGKKISPMDILRHIEKYGFLKRRGFFLDFFNEKYYLGKIKKNKAPQARLNQLQAELFEKKKIFRQMLKKYGKTRYLRNLILTVNEAVYFRTWRLDVIFYSSYFIQNLFDEIAKRTGLKSGKEAVYLLPSEVEDCLKNGLKPQRNLISQRKKAYVYITFGPKRGLVLQGADAIKIKKQLKIAEATVADMVKGNTAYKGRVKGKATLFFSGDSYKKLNVAEILITHSTSPEMTPYFKNIKAIVSEEGGITSHPALISREMKIPCVIGAKFATKIFKDGDIVEVDANRGIATKI